MNDRSLSRRTLLAATTATAATAAVAAGAGSASADEDAGASRDRLERLISRMSLEEKVGQLFVSRVWGHSATEPEQAYVDLNLRDFGVRSAAEMVAKYHVGGIIYFAWADNAREPRQIADLSNGIQRAGLAQPTPVPLLVSVDQEHGAVVARIGKPATQLPGAMALGAGRSRGDARSAGRIAGAELAAMGVRHNYAPVADVNVNPANPVINIRSFGSDPNATARMVSSQVRGYQSADVAACAKHFPGHGNTSVDSHTDLPSISHTREEWDRIDAPAFRAAIAAGIDSIMTAHIQFPALDPSNDPATLSRPILTGILREELGFDGVVVTDALNMQGVRTKYGEARVPVLALKAGVDQLLYPENLALAWNAVLEAVRKGELTEARLDESILRILRLKEKLGLFRDPYVSHREVDRTVGVPRHLAEAARIAERTTTLLVNKDGLLPLNRRRHKNLLVVGLDSRPPNQYNPRPIAALRGAFADLGFSATALPFEKSPTPAQVDQAVAAAVGKDAVVVVTYNVDAASGQRALVSRLMATGVPVVALAVRNPYDIAQLGDVPAALASYGWSEVELTAAARVIAGRVEPEGRLPVPVPRADDPSTALFPVGHGLRYDD
ncbi:glycoside hydrolase family 3 protein [Streptomyces sp. NPDC020141]|uniref:glycoside hydrolase family 3 protein n=1 Tax=Streptomyces sp. NPDC020141 TaxID=3365065 RepID=UPI003796D09F